MSDFISSDLLPDLWGEILKRHWTFLETEEGKQKIEERIKLEGCLKEFLCVVPHDRKFFLPETAYVLKQSIREMDDFTANKGIIGFESISQYANNLFTKPWRKEFRVLKMYSGSFQHDIQSNLVHTVKLFEAMGYRRLSDETLILDGPICPDQVTNVSRDAMAAYVECKIMKQIYIGLSGLGFKCSLKDIFNYREKHIGGATQTIQGISYAIQERRHRKEKLLSDNSYATIQHLSGTVPAPPPPPVVSQCPNCTPYYHNLAQTANLVHSQQQCSLHNNQMQSACALHPTTSKINAICNGSNNGKLFAPYSTPHMSHSRSLEHYNEPPPLLPHRHSFDHQQQGCTAHQSHYQVPRAHAQYAQHLYESPYDCIDGADESLEGSSASYAAVAPPNGAQTTATYTHPYNVSGNRYPLPYNISSELNAHYSTPTVTCNGIKGTNSYGANAVENMYATVSKPTHNWIHHNQQSQQILPPPRLLSSQAYNATKDYRTYRQRAFPPEQLIDFDDRAPLTSLDYHAHQHTQTNKQFNELYGDHSERLDREYKHHPGQRCLNHVNSLNPAYADPKDLLCQQHALVGTATSSDDVYGNNLYARPVPRSSRVKDASILGPQTKHMTDKYLRKVDNVQGYDDNNRMMQMELSNRSGDRSNGGPRRKLSSHTNEFDASDLSYESATFDDFVTVGHSEHPQRSPTQASKNQDGVGSFESWDYVFQNLERSGYSKDLGERGDLLVQSLDLDSLHVTGGGGSGNQVPNVEKRRIANQVSELKTTNANKQMIGEKSRTLEKVTSAEKREAKTTNQEKPSILKQTSVTNGIKKNKSTLKPTTSNNLNVDHSKSNGSATNERNITRQSSNNGSATNAAGSKAKTWTARTKQTPIATQVIVSSPNEWSCRFCTFLNPDTKHICEMCCRSKDFNLEATVSNTPTCV